MPSRVLAHAVAAECRRSRWEQMRCDDAVIRQVPDGLTIAKLRAAREILSREQAVTEPIPVDPDDPA